MDETKPKGALGEVIEHWLTSCLDTNEPPSKTNEDLQSDARTFFHYLATNTQVVTDSNVVLQTKSSHEEALAQLIQDLGPAFSHDHHRARLRAIYVMMGAIDGCKEARLSNKVIRLLGQFLLTHSGPVDDDDYVEDYDTMIRDAAILALSSLVSIPTSSSDLGGDLGESIIGRMELARSGIRRRCAVPETDDNVDPYRFTGRGATEDIRGGLSMLPRSKRAMCFDLVQKSITGFSSAHREIEIPIQVELVLSNLQIQMVEFAKFTTNCLQGESDPRCLLQLLKTIHNLQLALAPWFSITSISPEAVFPTEDIFDAVAPYFPVQFTPPPNDIHGITREGLHKALLSVLTFTDCDPGVSKFNRQPMMTLSADLFLETLLPAPGDDNPGPLDKQEALECLSALFFPNPDSHAVNHMETRICASVSQALRATHDEASLGVAQGGQIGSENKTLADYCRTLVSRMAFELEKSPRRELWDQFVNQTVSSLSNKMKNSPSSSRTSIAYLACLTASGGPRTLRACLAMGLQALLDFMEQGMGNNEDTAAATHGTGAFCSSCQVAMDRATAQGVSLHPHPMEAFSEKVAVTLLDIFSEDDVSPSILVGATRGLDCLLLAGGVNQLSGGVMDRLCTFFDNVSRDLTLEVHESELTNAYSIMLGHVIGGVLHKSSELAGSLLHSQKLEEHIGGTIYPALLPDTTDTSVGLDRNGLKVLSIAGSTSIEVAEPIITSCIDTLYKSLVEKGIESSLPAGRSVAYLLENGGETMARAFHKCSAVEAVMEFFNQYAKARSKDESRASMSNLSLPATPEEKAAFQRDLAAVRNIAGCLLPGYKNYVPSQTLARLLRIVSDMLPPLSEADSFLLCVWLPILSGALQAPSHVEDEDSIVVDEESSIEEIATELIQGLTDMVTSTDFDVATRSAAGSCLYAVVGLAKAEEGCPVAPVITSVVAPTLSNTVDSAIAENSLQILSLLGSAAANRGGVSASTADKVAAFLLEVACHGKALLPFSHQSEEQKLSCHTFEDEVSLQVSAASAYGSMLTVSTLKPLMKQRLVHGSSKFISEAYDEERDQAITGQSIKAPQVGLLAVVAHVLCSSNFARIGRSTMHQMATLVVEGLASSIFETGEDTAGIRSSTASKNLVLAATLKVICAAPSVVNGFALSIVTGLLRAYAVSDPATEVSCKLLALQGLEGVAHLEGAKSSTLSIKPAVVSVLAAAMNHPSGLLRQAAVDVRNAWYILD